jgi:hypothetical protein
MYIQCNSISSEEFGAAFSRIVIEYCGSLNRVLQEIELRCGIEVIIFNPFCLPDDLLGFKEEIKLVQGRTAIYMSQHIPFFDLLHGNIFLVKKHLRDKLLDGLNDKSISSKLGNDKDRLARVISSVI